MKVSRKVALGVAGVTALVIAGVFFAAAAGSGQAKPAAARVAVVADIGSLNDKGFNTLAVQGLARPRRISVSRRASIRQQPRRTASPNLQAAAQAGYGLVIANRRPVHVRTAQHGRAGVPEYEVPRHRRELP